MFVCMYTCAVYTCVCVCVCMCVCMCMCVVCVPGLIAGQMLQVEQKNWMIFTDIAVTINAYDCSIR